MPELKFRVFNEAGYCEFVASLRGIRDIYHPLASQPLLSLSSFMFKNSEPYPPELRNTDTYKASVMERNELLEIK